MAHDLVGLVAIQAQVVDHSINRSDVMAVLLLAVGRSLAIANHTRSLCQHDKSRAVLLIDYLYSSGFGHLE